MTFRNFTCFAHLQVKKEKKTRIKYCNVGFLCGKKILFFPSTNSIPLLSDLCQEFVRRGFPLGSESPEIRTLTSFGFGVALFVPGQVIDVVRRAAVFCPDSDKEVHGEKNNIFSCK